MSHNNRWLHEQLRTLAPDQVQASYDPLVVATRKDRVYRIYVPTPAEYIVTIDVVDKVIEMGGNTISYASMWCKPSQEALGYGKEKKIEILPHAAVLSMFKA